MIHRASNIWFPIVWVALALSLAWPGPAAAEVARIERGAPASAKDARALEKALAKAAATAGVCFQRDVPASVRIDLEIEPGGRVGKSEHRDGGAVGQCLAGVLAVQTLPAAGARLAVRVAFDTRALGGGAIEAALAPYQDKLRACHEQAQGKSRGGRAVVRFVIQPDGQIVDPSIQESELGDKRVERCLVDTMAGASLGAGVVAKNVRYSLQVAFPAGGAAAAESKGGDAGGGESLTPQKDGPLEAAELAQVMDRHKDAFHRCYAKQVEANRGLAGRVVLRFTVRPDGTVRNAKIKESTLGNDKVEACVVDVAAKLRFPASSGDTRVIYPFMFATK